MGGDILGFIVCAALITFSGTQLSKQGDKLAELTGLSKAWIGLILMATVTSLPELVTGISAVVVVDSPDLAAGNVLGSCAFNMLILSLLDLMVKKPITSLVKPSHVVTGAYGIILMAGVGAAVLLEIPTLDILWMSPFTPVLLFAYVAAMRSIFVYEKSLSATVAEQRVMPRTSKQNDLKRVISIYCLHAMIVIGTALFLPYFGENIARETGMSNSFFGTVFLAVTTSLPELVISISAIRIGSLDMAMGNLLGSNVFNIAILAFLDSLYTKGSLFAAISKTHLLSILGSIIMTAVVAIGLVTRPERKSWHLSTDSWIILLIYLLILLVIH